MDHRSALDQSRRRSDPPGLGVVARLIDGAGAHRASLDGNEPGRLGRWILSSDIGDGLADRFEVAALWRHDDLSSEDSGGKVVGDVEPAEQRMRWPGVLRGGYRREQKQKGGQHELSHS